MHPRVQKPSDRAGSVIPGESEIGPIRYLERHVPVPSSGVASGAAPTHGRTACSARDSRRPGPPRAERNRAWGTSALLAQAPQPDGVRKPPQWSDVQARAESPIDCLGARLPGGVLRPAPWGLGAMLGGGVGGEPHAGVHQQRAEAVAHVPRRPSGRLVVTQELVSISRKNPSSVCVGRQHSVSFSRPKVFRHRESSRETS